jgi:hypothetical protein
MPANLFPPMIGAGSLGGHRSTQAIVPAPVPTFFAQAQPRARDMARRQLLGQAALANSARVFTTTFSGAAENPISENGAWTTGTDPLSTVVRVSGTGIAYGTQTGDESSETPKRFCDSQAYLSGFPPNHRAELTISRTGTWSGDLEVEVLLGWSVSGSLRSPQPNFGPTHSDGIEVNLAIGGFGIFTGVARFLEVAVADFSAGPVQGLLPILDGDILCAQLTLNVAASTGTVTTSIKRAGVETIMGTVTDASLFRVGQPGIGFYRENVGGTPDPTQYAATAYTAFGI